MIYASSEVALRRVRRLETKLAKGADVGQRIQSGIALPDRGMKTTEYSPGTGDGAGSSEYLQALRKVPGPLLKGRHLGIRVIPSRARVHRNRQRECLSLRMDSRAKQMVANILALVHGGREKLRDRGGVR